QRAYRFRLTEDRGAEPGRKLHHALTLVGGAQPQQQRHGDLRPQRGYPVLHPADDVLDLGQPDRPAAGMDDDALTFERSLPLPIIPAAEFERLRPYHHERCPWLPYREGSQLVTRATAARTHATPTATAARTGAACCRSAHRRQPGFPANSRR